VSEVDAVRRASGAGAAVVGGVLLGLALGYLGSHFGVAGMFALPLGVILLLATLRRPTVGVALVLATIPVGLKTLPVGFVAVQGVAMAAIAVMILVRLSRGHTPLPLPAPILWGVGVLALCLLATPHAVNSTLAVKQDVDVVLGILVVLTTVAATTSLASIRRLAHLLLVVGAIIAFLSLGHASALHSVDAAQRVDNRLRGTFTEPNQFGGFCAIVVLIGVGLALSARSRAERWWAAALTLLTTIAMLLALSRGAWLGFMLGAVVMLVLVPRARRALAGTVVAMLVVVPLLGLFTPDLPQVTIVKQRVATLHVSAVHNPYDSRTAIWAEAAREISTAPLLGQGPGQFPVVSAQNESDAATVYAAHAHNVLLTVAAEAGIPAALGLVAFTVTMVVVLRRAVRRHPPRDAALVAGIGAALAVVVGQGIVDFTLRNADIFLLLSVLVGLVLSASRMRVGD
jgi:O-antigen ligase